MAAISALGWGVIIGIIVGVIWGIIAEVHYIWIFGGVHNFTTK
jgi:hypothetical protein